jgi:quercetin dioxygenase-like cupin family protein
LSTNTSGAFVQGTSDWKTVAPGVQRRILGYDDAIMMVAVNFEAGAVGTVHHHPHRQATYVAAGEFETIVGGESCLLKAGDSFFAAPDVPHGVIAVTPGTLIDVFAPAREDFLK